MLCINWQCPIQTLLRWQVLNTFYSHFDLLRKESATESSFSPPQLSRNMLSKLINEMNKHKTLHFSMCVCVHCLAPLWAADLRTGAAAETETAAGSSKFSSWAMDVTGSNTTGGAAACEGKPPEERKISPGPDWASPAAAQTQGRYMNYPGH